MISLIAGWPGLHVQSHSWDWSSDYAKGLCHCWLACQPHPNNVLGIHEVRVFWMSISINNLLGTCKSQTCHLYLSNTIHLSPSHCDFNKKVVPWPWGSVLQKADQTVFLPSSFPHMCWRVRMHFPPCPFGTSALASIATLHPYIGVLIWGAFARVLWSEIGHLLHILSPHMLHVKCEHPVWTLCTIASEARQVMLGWTGSRTCSSFLPCVE